MASFVPEIDSVASADSRSSHQYGFTHTLQKLKEHAPNRRSRNSMLMNERFRMSNRNLVYDAPSIDDMGIQDAFKQGGEENVVPNRAPISSEKRRSPPPAVKSAPTSEEPEHIAVATRLLRAHKVHVDRIMEILRIEMDALRDVDRLLEESGRPTEEEVLDYFESVGLCVDQRSQTGAQLLQELDRISHGAPQED